MASLNKVLLIGNLTRETELRHTPSGAAVCEIGLAVNRKYTSNGQEQEEVCFIDVTVWGKQAESCDRYLEKGSSALIEGRLQLDQWQDKTSGANRSKLRVVAERVQFMSRSNSGQGDGGGYQKNNTGGGYQSNNNGGAPSYGNNAQQSGQNSYGNNAPQSGQGHYTPPQQTASNAAPAAAPQNNQQAPPQMPDGAFDVGKGAEDDIPF